MTAKPQNPFMQPPANASGMRNFEGPLPPVNTEAWAVQPRRDDEAPPEMPVRKIHFDVFVTFRRWEGCKQCKDGVYGKVIQDDDDGGGDDDEGGNWRDGPRRQRREAPTVTLPEASYYNCPHVNRSGYEQLMEKLQREQNAPIAHEKTVLKDGSIQIEVTWAEKPQAAAQKNAQRRRF